MSATWALLLAYRLEQEASMARSASRLVSWCVQRSSGAWLDDHGNAIAGATGHGKRLLMHGDGMLAEQASGRSLV